MARPPRVGSCLQQAGLQLRHMCNTGKRGTWLEQVLVWCFHVWLRGPGKWNQLPSARPATDHCKGVFCGSTLSAL